MRNHRAYCTAVHAAAADLAAADVLRVLKNSILFLLLDGTAVHRCDNWLVFSDPLAAEGGRSQQCDLFHRRPEVYPFIHSLGTCSAGAKLQVAAYKGDTPKGVTEPTFPLTYIEKPIIINSFHRGLGG